MAINLEDHYPTRLQGIRRQGGTVQVYANPTFADENYFE
jgi:hypothetical protein